MLESLAKLSNILAKMYEITFYHQSLVRHVQRSGNNLFECEKVFQIIHIVLPTEQSILLKFKINLYDFKRVNEWLLERHLENTRQGLLLLKMFYITIGYKNKANIKVSASNKNIKMHQLFSEQRIFGVHVTIVQRKICVDLKRTCFWVTWRLDLWK